MPPCYSAAAALQIYPELLSLYATVGSFTREESIWTSVIFFMGKLINLIE